MNCKDAEHGFLDGQASPELDGHVRDCESCRQFVATQRQLDSMFARAYAPPVLSPAFRGALDASVRREKLGRWSRAHDRTCGAVVTTTVCVWFVQNGWQLGLRQFHGACCSARLRVAD